MDQVVTNLELSQRIGRLERARRRERTLVALGVLLLPLLAFAPPWTARDEVKATRFLLVDAEGNERGRFETGEDGYPRLRMFDAEGKARLEAMVSPDDVTLLLRDHKGKSRVGQSIDAGNRPHLLLSDAAGRPRWHASVNEKDRPNLIMFGAEDTIAAGVGILDDGTPWVRPLEGVKRAPQDSTPKDGAGK